MLRAVAWAMPMIDSAVTPAMCGAASTLSRLRIFFEAGAGLDVFDEEPAPASKWILSLDSVLAAPHMAGVTVESMIGMAQATARNILSVLDGKPNHDNVVNKEIYA